MLTYQQNISLLSNDANLFIGQDYVASKPKIYCIVDAMRQNEEDKELSSKKLFDSLNFNFSSNKIAMLSNTIYDFENFSFPEIVKIIQGRQGKMCYIEILQPDFCIHFQQESVDLSPAIELPDYYKESLTEKKYNSKSLIITASNIHKFTGHKLQYIQLSPSTQEDEIHFMSTYINSLSIPNK